MRKSKHVCYILAVALMVQYIAAVWTQAPVLAAQAVFYDSLETDTWNVSETVTVTEDTALTGSRSLLVKTTATTNNQAGINAALLANTEYVLEYYTKSDYEWGAIVQVLEGGTFTKIAQGQTAVSENGTEWKKVSVEFGTGDTPDVRLLVLGNLNGSGKGPVYLDDFSIYQKSDEEEPAKPGKLRDESFEEQNGAWTLSQNWTYSTDTARTGEYSARLTGSAEGAYWDRLLKQAVEVEENTDYTVCFYAKADKDWGAQLKILDTSGNTLKFTGVGRSEGWTKTELEFNSGSLTKIVIGFMDQGGTVYIDDVSLRKKGDEEEKVTNEPVDPVVSGTPADFSGKSELTVGYIGGSITEGAGASQFSDTWVYKTTQYLAQKTGKAINPVYAGVGGTGSDYGVYRLYDHVLRYNPDIVFIEFAINDAGRQSYAQVQRNIEGMIREILSMPKKVSIIMVFTTNNVFGAIDNVHQKVANYYGIPTINIQNYVRQRIEDGDFTWEDIGSDEVHPNSFGYQVYAEYIQSILDADFGKYVCNNTLVDQPMTAASYHTPRLAPVSDAQAGAGWQIHAEKAVSSQADAELTYTFKGQSFGFCNAVAGEGLRVLIDGDDYGVVYTNYGAPYRIIAENLEDTEHTVVLKNVSDAEVSISAFFIDDNEPYDYTPEESGGETEPDKELVANGGFEAGAEGWTMGAHWSVTGDAAYSGGHSLEMRDVDTAGNPVYDWCAATQTVSVEPETDYILSYYVNSKTHWGGLLKLFYDGEKNPAHELGFETTAGWERKTVDLYTGSHRKLQLQFVDNGGIAWVDDIILKKAGEAPLLLQSRCIPVQNAVEFPLDGKIKARFDTAMDAGSINAETVKLYPAGSTQAIPLTIVRLNDFEYEFTPGAPLLAGTKYELWFGTDVKSAMGIALAEGTMLRFTSAHAPFDVWDIRFEESGDRMEAAVTLKNSGDTEEEVLVLLKAEKEGCVEKIAATGGIIQNTGMKTEIRVAAAPGGPLSDYIYTVYVWDGLRERNPLCKPASTAEKPSAKAPESEPGVLTASQNKDTNEITVYGKPMELAAGKQATMAVLYDADTILADTTAYQSADMSSLLVYAGQVEVTEENQAADQFVMKADTDVYPVLVNAGTEQMHTDLHYYSQADIAGVEDVIASTSAEELLAALRQGKNLDILEIDTAMFAALNQERIAALMFAEKTKLEGLRPVTAQDMSEAARRAMAVQQLAEAKDAAEAAAVLKKYPAVFALEQAVGYHTYTAEYMSDAYRLSVADALRRVEYSTIDAVAARFDEQVVLKAIDHISNIAYIKTILNDNNKTLQWDLTKYNQLSDSAKVDRALYNNRSYQDLAAMKQVYTNALAQAGNDSGKGPGGGSGGAGPVQSWNVSAEDGLQQPSKPEQLSQPFYDLAEVEWAREAIESLAQRGVVSGGGDGRFRPGDAVTREEFVKMLVGVFGLRAENAESAFADVPCDAWYYDAVSTAYTLGITSGTDAEWFGAGTLVTRQDMACLIKNCLAYKGRISDTPEEAPDFADMETVSDYARESVTLMKAYGIISGYADATFRPANTATRAEAAVMLYKAEGDR